MKSEATYRTWKEFEEMERRRVGTFQLSVDDLARDLYVDAYKDDDDDDLEIQELDFDE